MGVIILNWDAAVDERIGSVGLGAIARNHEGRVLAMHGSICKHIYNPTMVETLAAWKAVVLGVQLGVTYLEVEGDAKEVVQGINCASHNLGCDGPGLNDIKTLLQSFNTWKVTHVNRGGKWGCS
jgi:ribonuclease HI